MAKPSTEPFLKQQPSAQKTAGNCETNVKNCLGNTPTNVLGDLKALLVSYWSLNWPQSLPRPQVRAALSQQDLLSVSHGLCLFAPWLMKDGTPALFVAATFEFSNALSRHLKMTHSNECHSFSPFVWAETQQTFRNYVNAGLAFIWIRLFIQLWSMAKQLSVVSYLVITGVGRGTRACGDLKRHPKWFR